MKRHPMFMGQKSYCKERILSKLNNRFNAIFISDFSVKIDKLIPKFTWNYKAPRISKQSWKKLNKIGGLTLFYVKTYYKAIVLKTVFYGHKDRYINQWNWESRDTKHIWPTDTWQECPDSPWRKNSLFKRWC